MTNETQAEIEVWREVRVELLRDRRGIFWVAQSGSTTLSICMRTRG